MGYFDDKIESINDAIDNDDSDEARRLLEKLKEAFDEREQELENERDEAREEASSASDEASSRESEKEEIEDALEDLQKKYDLSVRILESQGISERDIEFIPEGHPAPTEILRKQGVIQSVQQAAREGSIDAHAACADNLFCIPHYIDDSVPDCKNAKGRFRG